MLHAWNEEEAVPTILYHESFSERFRAWRAKYDWVKVGSWAAAFVIGALIWVALVLTGYAIWEWVTR